MDDNIICVDCGKEIPKYDVGYDAALNTYCMECMKHYWADIPDDEQK